MGEECNIILYAKTYFHSINSFTFPQIRTLICPKGMLRKGKDGMGVYFPSITSRTVMHYDQASGI